MFQNQQPSFWDTSHTYQWRLLIYWRCSEIVWTSLGKIQILSTWFIWSVRNLGVRWKFVVLLADIYHYERNNINSDLIDQSINWFNSNWWPSHQSWLSSVNHSISREISLMLKLWIISDWNLLTRTIRVASRLNVQSY